MHKTYGSISGRLSVSTQSLIITNQENETDRNETNSISKSSSSSSIEVVSSQTPLLLPNNQITKIERRVSNSPFFNSSYIIEPVAFIINLSISIINFGLNLFIYHRLFQKIVIETDKNATVNYNFKSTLLLGNSHNLHSSLQMMNPFQFSLPPEFINFTDITHSSLSEQVLDKIRLQAQEQSAYICFVSSVCSGLPLIIMTHILGVNCSLLGRKTLIIFYLLCSIIRVSLYVALAVYLFLPDWLFYVAATIDGMSGSMGILYLSLYCYITDVSPADQRSFRITLANNLNLTASLVVTMCAGYAIVYLGYVYLFVTSLVLCGVSLVYLVIFIPEPLEELRGRTLWQKVRVCSLKRTFKCFNVLRHKKNVDNYCVEQSLERNRLIVNESNGNLFSFFVELSLS
jgi:MFS family permease